MIKTYTGIGSRRTPKGVCEQMSAIARQLASRGWLLRSGGVDGADTAFEIGCIAAFGRKEIYLPWRGFNRRQGGEYCYSIPPIAYESAEIVIGEKWKWLSTPVRKLHARNTQQVAGKQLEEASNFLLCWTPRGDTVGGTSTAIVFAEAMGVRVINLAREEWSWDTLEKDRRSLIYTPSRERFQ